MKFFRKRAVFSFILSCGLCARLFGGAVITAHAEPIDYNAQAQANQLIAVESNQYEGWPQGPAVSAKSAILMEANSGAILYAKNIHEKLYPASTTKILTGLIAMEESRMDEEVVHSAEAVNAIRWWEDSNIAIKPNETLTMEQTLYGLMVGSANECGNAIGEHISGSMEAFAQLMNERAAELGCTDSNFVTTNGIHDENHYTSAHDLALIAQQYFSYDLLCKMSSTPTYTMPASPTLSQELVASSKNQLLPGRKYAYEWLVGSKTGYTSLARSNLVSCAEKDGLKLICVVMADESPQVYTDTIDLFNYGFSNFAAVSAAEHDTRYTVPGNSFFETDNDIFGSSGPILSIDPKAYIVLPTDASYEDTASELNYETKEDGQAGLITYSYHGQPVGSAALLFSKSISSADAPGQAAGDTADANGAASANSAGGLSTASAQGSPDAAAGAIPSSAKEQTDNALTAAKGAADETADESDTQTAAKTQNATRITADQTADKSAVHENNIVFVNVKKVLLIVGGVALLLILLVTTRSAVHNYFLSKRRKAIMKRRRGRSQNQLSFDKHLDPFRKE